MVLLGRLLNLFELKVVEIDSMWLIMKSYDLIDINTLRLNMKLYDFDN